MEFVESEVNDILYGKEIAKMAREGLEERLKNHTPVPTNFAVQLLYSPKMASLGSFDPTADLTRIMLANEDPRAMWAETIKRYEAQGLWEAVEEVNAEIQRQGLDQS
jgi:putative aldouronate transport system substrate-binding protein